MDKKTRDILLNRKRVPRAKKWFNDFKNPIRCPKCGESRNCCLEPHHINSSEKKKNISEFIKRGTRARRTLKELKKCIMICRNCHQEFHYIYTCYDNVKEQLEEYLGKDVIPCTEEYSIPEEEPLKNFK